MNKASEIIGNHFSEVQDKLLNFYNWQNQKSNFGIISFNQTKSSFFTTDSVSNAVNFARTKVLPYAIIPILLLILFFVTGNSEIISNSFAHVVNYETKYLRLLHLNLWC